MPGPSAEDRDEPGLCASCRHARVQPNARGSVFWRCARADSDARFPRYPPLPVRRCAGHEARAAPDRGAGLLLASAPERTMTRWYILSAIGRDRPGLVSELAQLVLDCEANLEDSRMTILGSDFAVILLCASRSADAADRLALGAKRLERDHGLTILIRELSAGARPPVPAPGTRLYRVEAAGEDRAGIVAGICGVLARHGVNIVELDSKTQPGPGGASHYRMTIRAEVPEALEPRALREALDREAERLVLDVALMPL